MKNKIYLHLAAVCLFVLLFIGCGGSDSGEDSVDYSKSEHWLSLPALPDKDVDVFYLYPTVWQRATTNDPVISTIDDPQLLQRAPLALDRQATAFATVANVYAPFYRQADPSYVLLLPAEQRDEIIGSTPASDAAEAFDYYIEHYNNGRPFILAGHSQGSNVLLFLLSDYLKAHPDVYSRMIAAYVIGYSVTAEYLAGNQHLKFAEGPDDTGVIISYNTEAPETISNPVVLPGALVINPLTWTRQETLASENYNLGSIKINTDGSVAKDTNGNPILLAPAADAQVDQTKGVVICSTVDVDLFSPGPPNAAWPRGVYHTFDYPFYYYNLRANAENRINAFISQGPTE